MPKIDISPLKKASHGIGSDVVRELIQDQKSTMDLDDFLANVKAWERALKKEAINK